MWQSLVFSKVMWQGAAEIWKASCGCCSAPGIIGKAAGKISSSSFNLISGVTAKLGECSWVLMPGLGNITVATYFGLFSIKQACCICNHR